MKSQRSLPTRMNQCEAEAVAGHDSRSSKWPRKCVAYGCKDLTLEIGHEMSLDYDDYTIGIDPQTAIIPTLNFLNVIGSLKGNISRTHLSKWGKTVSCRFSNRSQPFQIPTLETRYRLVSESTCSNSGCCGKSPNFGLVISTCWLTLR